MISPGYYDQINLDTNKDKFNKGFNPDNIDESGIETYSQAPSNSHYDVINTTANIYNNPNASNNVNRSSNFLNTSSISFDLLNTNANGVKTRYDVKSLSNSSLYGSRKSVQAVSVNTNGTAITNLQSNQSMRNSSFRSSKKLKIKKLFMKSLFSDNDAYSNGEYVKNELGETDGSTSYSKKKSGNRETWSGKFDFFLSCLGYAVGLGAVWRFPYLCFKNGGGVFLIPYTIFLFLVGIPLFFLELNLGQFTSQGPFKCWKMAPIFKGLGISMNIASFYFCLYYNMIIAYSLYYLVNSFRLDLDWSKCDYSWASPNCTDDFGDSFIIRCDQADVYRDMNGLCYNYSGIAGRTVIGWWDIKKRLDFKKPVLPSQDYYYNNVLQKTDTLNNSGGIVWQLAIALLVAWVIVFFCIFKGIKSSGKVVYFTSLFPYVVLLILGINGWRLEGAGIGISYYLKPDFSKLLDVNVWFDAAVQIFFTMSTSYGGLIALASYNKFNQNTTRDTFIITISNSLTAIFAGFVVFSYIGYLSFITHQSVDSVVSSGSGLAFIIFPFAVTQLAFPPVWSILFFVMMLTLGLDSQFATFETIITTIMDSFPKLKRYRVVLIATLCTIMYLLGLTYCTRGGTYWIDIMDKFSSGWAVLIIGTLECICIGWVYGFKNFQKDIYLMTKSNNILLRYYMAACWCVISPVLLMALVIISWIQYRPLKVDNYVFPTWANVIGWLMTAFELLGMFGWALYCLIDALFINKRSLMTLIKPEADWGPLLDENKRLAVHLENLEPYHESKRIKKLHINTISLPKS